MQVNGITVMGKTHEEVIEMVNDLIHVLALISLTYLVLNLGNSHFALTLLCRSSGSNGTKPQQTFGLSPPMAAGAAKECMYICS